MSYDSEAGPKGPKAVNVTPSSRRAAGSFAALDLAVLAHAGGDRLVGDRDVEAPLVSAGRRRGAAGQAGGDAVVDV